MDAARLDEFRQWLRSRKNALIQDVRIDAGAVDVEASPDELDMAAAEADREVQLRLQDRDRRLLHSIDDALVRLDEGSFGNCVSCGEEIDERRLKAHPTATRCIDCMTEVEKREGRRRSF